MQPTSTNPTDKDMEMFLMLNGLVVSITGVPIAELEETKKEEIIQKCVDYFTSWVENYIEKKYDKKDAIRLKVAHSGKNEIDVFAKFEDLGSKFDEAWEAFFQEMGNQWEAKTQKATLQK